jgi:hypothetical protein
MKYGSPDIIVNDGSKNIYDAEGYSVELEDYNGKEYISITQYKKYYKDKEWKADPEAGVCLRLKTAKVVAERILELIKEKER